MNEIYLAGSSGYIGNIAYKNLSKIFNVIPLTRSSSLEEFYSEILDKESNQILIYAAGNKNIKDCEGNFNIGLEANFHYLKLLANKLKNPFIIYLSTDYAFDGLQGNYSSHDLQSADTNYGKSKIIAENWLLNKYLGQSNILRVSAVCSDNSSFIRYLLKESEIENNMIEVADNSYFSPTSINLLIECLSFLIKERQQGISHLSGPRTSRADFAMTTLNLYGKKINLKNKDYKLINSFLRPDLSLQNSFLHTSKHSDHKFFKLLNRVFNRGYQLEDFSEDDIIQPRLK
jgi:dTDP-4-dehydrorhamnose reductase|tara:strand:+ start:6285 stop:7148 length:864 start_codon:yes stop_codon:yes gene_type:complete